MSAAPVLRRIEALEQAGADGDDFIIILRQIVTPGALPSAATHARVLGQSFVREPAETEAQFIERLRGHLLARRRPGQHGVQVLVSETDLAL